MGYWGCVFVVMYDYFDFLIVLGLMVMFFDEEGRGV